jgi:4-hydroxy-3-polyprenylbenzoate decarboxylase
LDSKQRKKRVVVALTGASGVSYGIKLLEILNKMSVETYLIMTPAASITIKAETNFKPSYLEKLASRTFRFNDIAAPISSGSFHFDAMVVVPCSMHTLGAIATGTADNLVTRSAEVALKERRTLILVPRETPMTLIHLENMVRASQAGAIILPAMPAFYHKPKNIDDILNHLVGKILDMLGIEHHLFKRWEGLA